MKATSRVVIGLIAVLLLVVLSRPTEGADGIVRLPHLEGKETQTSGLFASIAQLDQEIRQWVSMVEYAIETDREIRSQILQEARTIDDFLDDLELRVAREGGEHRALLEDKIKTLRRLAGNVRWSAENERLPAGRQSDVLTRIQLRSVRGAVPNDDCEAASEVFLGSVVSNDSTGATNDGQASCGSSLTSPDVWFRFVAPASQMVVFDTIGSEFDTVLSVHSSCPGTIDNQVECNDDAVGLQSALAVQVIADQEYLIRISGVAGASGLYVLRVVTGGSVSGNVSGVSPAVPVSDLRVELWNAEGVFEASTTTDEDGDYSFPDLPQGSYRVVTAENGSFIDELFDNIPCLGGPSIGCDPRLGDAIDLDLGMNITGIDFELDRAGVFHGQVVDAITGDPLEYGAGWVKVYNEMGGYVGRSMWSTGGHFTSPSLPEGTYFALADPDAYVEQLWQEIDCPGGVPAGCAATSGTPIDIRLNDPVWGISFPVRQMGVVSGRVVSRTSHEPQYGVRVEIWDLDGDFIEYDYTDDQGLYTVGNLLEASYYVFASGGGSLPQLFDGISCLDGPGSCDLNAGTAVGVKYGISTENINFSLDRLGAISGTVVDEVSLEPVVPAWVRFYGQDGEYLGYDTTDSSGSYIRYFFWPGSYYVVVSQSSTHHGELYDDVPCPGGFPAGCELADGDLVSTDLNATTEGVDFKLASKASLSGTVVDSGAGSPLQDIRVGVWTTSSYPAKTTVTGADGAFSIVGLDEGTVFVSTYDSSLFVDELYDDIRCPNGPPSGCTADLGDPVDIPMTGNIVGIDFALTPRGKVEGVVVDRDSGQPVSGVAVKVWDSIGEYAGSASTDSEGSFVVSGLSDGPVFAVAGPSSVYLGQLYDDIPCPGGGFEGCNPPAGTPIAVAAGTTTSGIDFALDQAGALAGTVRSAEPGSVVGYATVYVYSTAGVLLKSRETSSQGVYSVTGLESGTYFAAAGEYGYRPELYLELPCGDGPSPDCSVTNGVPILVENGTTTEDVDFTLTPVELGGVSGFVADGVSGQAVDNAKVLVESEDGMTSKYSWTNSSGIYEITSLAVGNYRVATDKSGYVNEVWNDHPYHGAPDFQIGDLVEVQADTITRHVNFQLVPRAHVTGTVTDEVNGAPVPDVHVHAREVGGDTSYGSTDSYGRFTVYNLMPGKYNFYTTKYGSGYIDEIYDDIQCPEGMPGGCDPMVGAVVELGPGETLEITIDLLPTASVSGRVVSAIDGAPLEGVYVELWNENGGSPKVDRTDASGIFLVNWLDDGAYYAVTDDNDNFMEQLYDSIPCPGGPGVGCVATEGTRIEAAAGQPVTGIDFALDHQGVITGVVLDAVTGQPPTRSCRVYAYSDSGPNSVGYGYANADGQFLIEGLVPGYYYLVATSSAYQGQLYDGLPCPGLPPGGCDFRDGVPIPAEINTVTGGIEFRLVPLSGGISGRVTGEESGLPVYNILVRVFDEDGNEVDWDHTDGEGRFVVEELAPGAHFVVTNGLPWSHPYVDELFDGFYCVGGPPEGCDPTKGTPVTVVHGSVIQGIDIGLESLQSALSGSVTAEYSSEPLVGTYIDIWRADSGDYVKTVATSPSGSYFCPIAMGSYLISTDNGDIFTDEIFDDVACSDGPAYAGLCEPMLGDPVEVFAEEISGGVDFALAGRPAEIFADGFESGSTSNWQ